MSSVGAQVTLQVLPDDGIRSIISMIDKAQRRINVVMYTFTNKKIASAVIRAHARGVVVNVMLEKKPYKMPEVNRAMVDHLVKAGIPVFGVTPNFV